MCSWLNQWMHNSWMQRVNCTYIVHIYNYFFFYFFVYYLSSLVKHEFYKSKGHVFAAIYARYGYMLQKGATAKGVYSQDFLANGNKVS